MEKQGNICKVCGETAFSLHSGYFYCDECGTRAAEIQEIEFETQQDHFNIRFRKKRIQSDATSTKKDDRLTTWEGYNYILIGLVGELQVLGASDEFKLTTLQLWTAYLKKMELAFTSKQQITRPKLPASFKKQDAEILHGMVRSKRKRTPSGTASGSQRLERARHKRALIAAEYEKIESSQKTDVGSLHNVSLHSLKSSSTSKSKTCINLKLNRNSKKEKLTMKKKLLLKGKVKDLANLGRSYKNVKLSPTYLKSATFITRNVLWGILYLALNITGDAIQLSDLIRFCRDGYISYYDFKHFFPENYPLTRSVEHIYHNGNHKLPCHHGIRLLASKLVRIIDVRCIRLPNILALSQRYCMELQLPAQISDFICRFYAISPPVMHYDAQKCKILPNYEGRAMSFVIFVLKIIFGLDGFTEFAVSETGLILKKILCSKADVLKEFGFKDKYTTFIWSEWVHFIEYRKLVLAQVHFPTKLLLFPRNNNNSTLFVDYWRKIHHKEDSDETISPMKEVLYDLLPVENKNTKSRYKFEASFTPLKSFVDMLKRTPVLDFDFHLSVEILFNDFSETYLDLLVNSKTVKKILKRCGVNVSLKRNLLVDENVYFKEMFKYTYRQTKLQKFLVKTNMMESVDVNFIDPFQYKENLYIKNKQNNKKLKEFHASYVENCNKIHKQIKNKINKDKEMKKRLKREYNNHKKLIMDGFKKVQEVTKVLLPKIVKSFERDKINKKDCELKSPITHSKRIRNALGMFVKTDSSETVKPKNKIPKINNIKYEKPSVFCQMLRKKLVKNSKSEKKDETENNRNISEKIQLCIAPMDYWLNHGDPNNLSNENFKNDIELKFSNSFSWLLKECARMVEMSTKDLYLELMLVETRYAIMLDETNRSSFSSNLEMNNAISRCTKLW